MDAIRPVPQTSPPRVHYLEEFDRAIATLLPCLDPVIVGGTNSQPGPVHPPPRCRPITDNPTGYQPSSARRRGDSVGLPPDASRARWLVTLRRLKADGRAPEGHLRCPIRGRSCRGRVHGPTWLTGRGRMPVSGLRGSRAGPADRVVADEPWIRRATATSSGGRVLPSQGANAIVTRSPRR